MWINVNVMQDFHRVKYTCFVNGFQSGLSPWSREFAAQRLKVTSGTCGREQYHLLLNIVLSYHWVREQRSITQMLSVNFRWCSRLNGLYDIYFWRVWLYQCFKSEIWIKYCQYFLSFLKYQWYQNKKKHEISK